MHFCVLVIGEDVDKPLAPYHEYESDGIDDEYVVDVDVTEKMREQYETEHKVVTTAEGSALKRYKEVMSFAEFLTEYDYIGVSTVEYKAYKPGKFRKFKVVDARNGVVKVVKHTNPNAKYDAYRIGGRYSETLKSKDGLYVVQACFGDIKILSKTRIDAVVKDSQWHDKSSNSSAWQRKIEHLLKDVDDDTLISVVDCRT